LPAGGDISSIRWLLHIVIGIRIHEQLPVIRVRAEVKGDGVRVPGRYDEVLGAPRPVDQENQEKEKIFRMAENLAQTASCCDIRK